MIVVLAGEQVPLHTILVMKLFSLKNSPDILGYCGDAYFQVKFFHKFSEMDEYNLLFQDNLSSMERSDIVLKQINTQFAEYPLLARNVSSIYHISRDTDESFHAYKYTYDVANSGWIPQYLHIKAQESALIFWDGSFQTSFIDSSKSTITVIYLEQAGISISAFVMHLLIQ